MSLEAEPGSNRRIDGSDFFKTKISQVSKHGEIKTGKKDNPVLGTKVVVTEENKVVGLVSSFDLLRLVEDHRFVMKNPPTESKKKGGQRRQSEVLGKPE